MNVLIGHTGFVGGNLALQHAFDRSLHSRNIDELRGVSADLIVCAGVQAKKWWANQNESADWEGIEKLLRVLDTVQAGCFVLISTVDVYPQPLGVDESTLIEPGINHVYGRHRYAVEEYVTRRFSNALVLRLPGLFGRGLKKNVIHDLLNRHELEKINPAGVYQYYDLGHLWADIGRAREKGLALLNLATEPIPTREIWKRFFPHLTLGQEQPFAASYDMHTRHAGQWASPVKDYLYSREQVLADLEHFIRATVPTPTQS
jgi:nucleoside-diphosphate-sugar epimerase